jgi:hypothetical protein
MIGTPTETKQDVVGLLSNPCTDGAQKRLSLKFG